MDKSEAAGIIADGASKVQYTGSGAAILFGLTLGDWGVVFGIIIGSIGLLVNIYFKRKQFNLNKKFMESRLDGRRRGDVTEELEIVNKYGQSD